VIPSTSEKKLRRTKAQPLNYQEDDSSDYFCVESDQTDQYNSEQSQSNPIPEPEFPTTSSNTGQFNNFDLIIPKTEVSAPDDPLSESAQKGRNPEKSKQLRSK
jgi:hypothetical protein